MVLLVHRGDLHHKFLENTPEVTDHIDQLKTDEAFYFWQLPGNKQSLDQIIPKLNWFYIK